MDGLSNDTRLLRVSSAQAVSGVPNNFVADIENLMETANGCKALSVEAVGFGHAQVNIPTALSFVYESTASGTVTIAVPAGQYDFDELVAIAVGGTLAFTVTLGVDGKAIIDTNATDLEYITVDATSAWLKLGFTVAQDSVNFAASTLTATYMPALYGPQVAFLESASLCDSHYAISADGHKAPYLCQVPITVAFSEHQTYHPPSHADRPSIIYKHPYSIRHFDLSMRHADGSLFATAGEFWVVLRLWF